ncbi:DUF1735 domain-containing protein [Flammeovirga sp. SubArs3]|uniref:DUF1735 domain-containing protein n=1 Tax=Flammeovirga sp. SubArs3 TaxID=2995316 RepID=UPI00248AA5D0|nr:DUF1735 domain-containing protein [Flammeovirga sp. SubArs3]
MNYKRLFFVILSIFGLSSCESYEDYLTDFDYSTVYFPYQRPVRTSIVDSEEKIHVGVVLGGVRENEKRIISKFEIQPELLENTPWKLLPNEYYTLGHDSEMIIEPGSFQGLIEVKLNDLFYQDTLTLANYYALPFKILSSTADSIIVGDTDRGVASRDYMIPVFKYINTLEGNWYHQGEDIMLNTNGDTLYHQVYRNKDLVKNKVTFFKTKSRYEISTNTVGGAENGEIILHFGNNEEVIISPTEVSNIQEITTNMARYQQDEKVLFLDYNYQDLDGYRHQVKDTLTFRNLDITLELWEVSE